MVDIAFVVSIQFHEEVANRVRCRIVAKLTGSRWLWPLPAVSKASSPSYAWRSNRNPSRWGIWPYCVTWILASPLIARTLSSTALSCCVVTASHLFITMTSAWDICRCAVVSWWESSWRGLPETSSGLSSRLSKMFFASTNVTIPSRYIELPRPSSTQNKGARLPGSARPLVSRMT